MGHSQLLSLNDNQMKEEDKKGVEFFSVFVSDSILSIAVFGVPTNKNNWKQHNGAVNTILV